jgi:hypothetical protein
MSRKVLTCMLFSALILAIATVPVMVVVAQEPAPVPVAPETTFGWVVLAWLIYSIVGLLASVSKPGETFDTLKFVRSFLIMLVTGLVSIALHLTPGAITTQFGGILDMTATFILNTGPGLWIIYAFDKLIKLIMNLKAKLEAARALAAAGPGPPKP